MKKLNFIISFCSVIYVTTLFSQNDSMKSLDSKELQNSDSLYSTLYLCGEKLYGVESSFTGNDFSLKESICHGWTAKPFAQGSEFNFYYPINGDIPGGVYEILITITIHDTTITEEEFKLSIIHLQNETKMVIAETLVKFTSAESPYKIYKRLTGIDPNAKTNDWLVFVIKNLSGGGSNILFGGWPTLPKEQYKLLSQIKVPWRIE